ncbi:ribose 5-phosphate isomerase B [Candidatus Caldatribacterium sp.]|uniref:ribose 5-phosphate isomerase B n=1 Tax=Candidatus Caldatribacterium sp. TaxID=2282143 RepID=UPI0029918F69|nr:ribose 5-phosphate isomerase B [Candidatus Caldatribacterium sp.]MDW8081808.1 ribose 5-phosphate isomerase B [Candidatus Calescibacterium sp.]
MIAVYLVIASDNFGYPLKRVIVDHLREKGVEFDDIGVFSEEEAVDYPDIALQACLGIREGRYQYGILICGTGIGMAIVANKIPGIYAACAHDIYSAERAKKSNNTNVLTLGRHVVGPELAKMLVDAWLASSFQGGRSTRKVEKIRQIEKDYVKEV